MKFYKFYTKSKKATNLTPNLIQVVLVFYLNFLDNFSDVSKILEKKFPHIISKNTYVSISKIFSSFYQIFFWATLKFLEISSKFYVKSR